VANGAGGDFAAPRQAAFHSRRYRVHSGSPNDRQLRLYSVAWSIFPKSDFRTHRRSSDRVPHDGLGGMEMILTTQFKKTTRPATPVTIRSSTDWKPEPCGLTREEIRAIIAEQLG